MSDNPEPEGHALEGVPTRIPGTFDYNSEFKETFREDLFRSKFIKEALYQVAPDCLREAISIINLPNDKELLPTKAKMIQYMLDKNILTIELPKLHMTYARTEQYTSSSNHIPQKRDTVRVTKEELTSFLTDAFTIDATAIPATMTDGNAGEDSGLAAEGLTPLPGQIQLPPPSTTNANQEAD